MLMTRAQKKQIAIMMAAFAAYIVFFWVALRYVRLHHPHGFALYVCAALPCVMICGLIASAVVYLYEESDGYSRELAMRCMLWGAASAMTVNFFLMFLRMFGWRGQAPVYLEICAFAAASLVARVSYEASNRPEDCRKGN